jgi:hypothetical protein
MRWTIETRQDVISRKLWPKIDISDNQEFIQNDAHASTKLVDDQQKETNTQSHQPGAMVAYNHSKRVSTLISAPIITYNRSGISYDITKKNHIFTAHHYNEPKPTDNVWIGISHTYLPTLWCPKCNKWDSHPETLLKDRMRFIDMMEEKNSRKEQNYGPSNGGNK